MKAAVHNTERGVVVAGNDSQLMIGANACVNPREHAMLGDGRRGDIARLTSKRLPHA